MKCLIDLDGTMYHGTRIIESAKKFLNECSRRGIDYIFLTNNASRTPVQAQKHMLDMGYENIEPEMFYTSAMAAAAEIAKTSSLRRAFYIGEEGLKQALIEQGFELVEENADFVFVGLNRQADYQTYSKALRLLYEGAQLVGTNDDLILLSEQGVNVGNGSIVRMLELCSKKTSVRIGKPSSVILDCALNHFGWRKEEVLIIGDNLDTDIKCGVDAQIKSAFVLTGVHTKEDLKEREFRPDYIVHDLCELLDIIEKDA